MIKLLLCWSRKNYIKSDGALIGSQCSVYSVCGSFSEVVQLLGRIPVLPCLNADSSATSQTLLSWISAQVITAAAHTHTHTRLTALFPGLPRWAGTRKVKPIWILLTQETVSGSGISWVVCKSAPRSRQITMPAPHCSIFLQAGCPSCCPTNSVKALKAMITAVSIKNNNIHHHHIYLLYQNWTQDTEIGMLTRL